MVLEIMVPFWVPILIRHLLFRVTIVLTTTQMTLQKKFETTKPTAEAPLWSPQPHL